MCYCDVALCDSVRETLDLDCFDRVDELTNFPKLSGWLQRMEALPQLAQHWAQRGAIIPDWLDMKQGKNS
jgi:hypothetical protein